MIVVPIKNDRITSVDSDEFICSSYTNLKQYPCVYLRNSSTLFFKSIDKINDIKVDYNEKTKLFDALGPIKRRIHLPQTGDIIVLKTDEEIIVKSLKLHGHSKKTDGLLILSEFQSYNLGDIKEIKRKEGLDNFNLDQFKRTYIDYFPL